MYEDHQEQGYFSEEVIIDAIRALHEELIFDRKTMNGNYTLSESTYLLYELKNGRKLVREYHARDNEYKRTNNDVLNVDDATVDRIRITVNGPISKNVAIVDPTEMKEALKILQEEINNESYEDLISKRAVLSTIEILLESDTIINVPEFVSIHFN